MLFSKQVPLTEDHGHGLLAEFEDLVSGLVERTEHRAQVVAARLAALEHEDNVLGDLRRRLSTTSK